MRVWTWEFDCESGLAPFTRLLLGGEDSRAYVKTLRETTDRELAQFIVDALNAAEQREADGARFFDALGRKSFGDDWEEVKRQLSDAPPFTQEIAASPGAWDTEPERGRLDAR